MVTMTDGRTTSPKTPSERKMRANKLNAQKSTGPKTAAGKNSSRWNAMKHGLLAKSAVVDTHEDRGDFINLLRTLEEELQPSSVIEEILVERIAECYWNLGRITAIRRTHMAKLLDSIEDEYSWYEGLGWRVVDIPILGPTLEHLYRYETTIENRLYKALHELERVQRLRGGESVLSPLVVESKQLA